MPIIVRVGIIAAFEATRWKRRDPALCIRIELALNSLLDWSANARQIQIFDFSVCGSTDQRDASAPLRGARCSSPDHKPIAALIDMETLFFDCLSMLPDDNRLVNPRTVWRAPSL